MIDHVSVPVRDLAAAVRFAFIRDLDGNKIEAVWFPRP
jgi:catechol 2,3-dioxygenase-like lactoylglutathione lyase family enzyme